MKQRSSRNSQVWNQGEWLEFLSQREVSQTSLFRVYLRQATNFAQSNCRRVPVFITMGSRALGVGI